MIGIGLQRPLKVWRGRVPPAVLCRVRLDNRPRFAQTSLWWANVGVRVDELYQCAACHE
jgi:hypothetical protein